MSSCDWMLLSVLQIMDFDLSLRPDQTRPAPRIHLEQPINEVVPKVYPNIAAPFNPIIRAFLLPAAQPFRSEATPVFQGQCQRIIAEFSSAGCCR